MKPTKALLSLMLMGSLIAQDLPTGKSQQPKPKKDFNLTYYDIRESIHDKLPKGRIIVEFYVNELGQVEEPVVIDTFDISLNDVVLDKVKQTTYHPALQNGIPVKVKYSLPIHFK